MTTMIPSPKKKKLLATALAWASCLLPVGALVANGGNTSCSCIDATRVLEAQSNCDVAPDDLPGVLVAGRCVPVSDYGSHGCQAYDLHQNPACSSTRQESEPEWCTQQWCWVDRFRCHSSRETAYASQLFEGLHYSYSTCGSNAQEWLDYKTVDALVNKTLVFSVPVSAYPVTYKTNEEDTGGTVYGMDGPEIFDPRIPWQGSLIDYFEDAILKPSAVSGAEYHRRSKGAQTKGIASHYTQAVSDVEAGIADAGMGLFWVTAQRLAMTSFTVPITSDPINLWIPQPPLNDNLQYHFRKLLKPFSPALWACVVGCIVVFAVMSIVVARHRFRQFKEDDKRRATSKLRRTFLVLAESLHAGFLEFFARSIQYRDQLAFSQKSLNLGFAFATFVTVTAYTANLAAFSDAQRDHPLPEEHGGSHGERRERLCSRRHEKRAGTPLP